MTCKHIKCVYWSHDTHETVLREMDESTCDVFRTKWCHQLWHYHCFRSLKHVWPVCSTFSELKKKTTWKIVKHYLRCWWTCFAGLEMTSVRNWARFSALYLRFLGQTFMNDQWSGHWSFVRTPIHYGTNETKSRLIAERSKFRMKHVKSPWKDVDYREIRVVRGSDLWSALPVALLNWCSKE